MKRFLWSLAATGLIAVAAWGADAGRAGDEFKVEEGYTLLFNGTDLSGWRLGNERLDGKTETAKKQFQVANGVILVEGKAGGNLYTTREFNKDFHLKLEFRAAPKADSGLFIRGPQLQVRDYPRAGPYNPKGFKDGDWNELDVTVKGGVVTTNVNGKTLTDKDVLELTVRGGKPEAKLNGKEIDVGNVQVSVGAAALCKCNGEVIEKAFKVPAKGGIGLQSEVGKFEFRRIRIKELE